MRFRLKAFGGHVLASALALSLVLGTLYIGWYRWPGWYLADAAKVITVLAGVDVVVGPLLTLVIASPAKQRRDLIRDIGIIVAVQLLALSYGAIQLWNGRPLYYSFDGTRLQSVQAYDITSEEASLGREQNPALAPHWYSLPRFIFAPLPEEAAQREKIEAAGGDVIGMPRYFKTWEAGLPALRKQLRKLDDIGYFPKDRRIWREKMQDRSLPLDKPNVILFAGRGHPLLAVFDLNSMQIIALIRSQ